MSDSTKRFSNRVDNYIKYRPNYPEEIINLLKSEINFSKNTLVADIGAGTGISTELFLKNGNTVYGVEPNKEMRTAAERLLKSYKNFISIDGQSDNTKLDDKSIDLITAFQAFHWFNVEKTKLEFKRILRDNGFVVLIWNERKSEGSAFNVQYEEIIKKYANDYEEVKHQNIDEIIFKKFFDKNGFKTAKFENRQDFDFEGLKGRTLSSSYMPVEGDSKYNLMITALQNLYEKFNEKNKIIFEYETKVYYGKI